MFREDYITNTMIGNNVHEKQYMQNSFFKQTNRWTLINLIPYVPIIIHDPIFCFFFKLGDYCLLINYSSMYLVKK